MKIVSYDWYVIKQLGKGGGTWGGREGKNGEKRGGCATTLDVCGRTMLQPWSPSTAVLDSKIRPEMRRRWGGKEKKANEGRGLLVKASQAQLRLEGTYATLMRYAALG